MDMDITHAHTRTHSTFLIIIDPISTIFSFILSSGQLLAYLLFPFPFRFRCALYPLHIVALLRLHFFNSF